MANTASLVDEGDGDDEPGAEPQLIVAMRADRLTQRVSRHRLGDVDVAELGRARKAKWERRGGTVRRLALGLDDPATSEQHARLARVHGKWVLEDAGSKNGSQVNGAVVGQAVLADGDLIELGQTLLLFRDAVEAAPGPADAALDELDPQIVDVRSASGPLARAYQRLAAVAGTALPILLGGATGTGKEVAARAIHAASRRPGAFVAINCGAIPAELAESELFGHRRGAFSGAVDGRPGHVRAADGGTLFLDEIADLPLATQAALLRVLQEREVVPVGESTPVRVDVRVIAASHAALDARVADGRFREDLRARLDGLAVTLPTLAGRREDVGALAAALIARHAPGATLAMPAARALWAHDWPGNVRELEMALARAAALAGGARIELTHLPPAVQDAARRAAAPPPALDDDDRTLRAELTAALERRAGNISAVSRDLNKARWQIHRWLRRFALDPTSFRGK